MISKEQILAALLKGGCWHYLTEGGMEFIGCPVSRVPNVMRKAGWRHLGRHWSDRSTLKEYGLTVVTARYVGGVRPKRFCDVVVVKDA